MRKRNFGYWFASTAVCSTLLLGSGTAIAQATDSSGADEGEIIVTAQRREQSVQDVGIAISVLSSEDLAKRGVTNVNQLQNVTSNLEVEPAFGGGTPQFRVRGIGFSDYASNNSPTVGVYVNEVAYPVPVMTQGLVFDVSRVEVLKGPQGTLYGRNTTGGAINFITNKPNHNKTELGATIEYGRFNAIQAEAYVSAPLTDGLAFRAAATTQQGGAFQRNRVTGESLGDANRLGGRFLLSYDKGSPFTALFDVHGGIDKSEAIGLYLLNDFQTVTSPAGPPGSGIAPVLGPIIPADKDRRATGWGVSPLLVRDAGLSPNQKPGRNNSTFGTSLNLGYDLGGVKLTSITSYDKMRRREYGDWDTAATVQSDVYFGSRINVFSQELRLSSTGKGPLTWVTGVYYSRQNQTEQFYSDFLNTLGVSVRLEYGQVVESIAALGQVEYAVTPKLNLIAGLRYESETRKLNDFTTRLANLPVTALAPTDVSTQMKPLTGKIGVEFKPIPTVLLYASASKGVKSGGFTAYNTGNVNAIQPFKEETLYAYEAGVKADITRAVQFNASAYYYDYRNQQVLDSVCGTNGAIGRFANAKKSRIYGFEGELNLKPAKGLTISQYASYKNGQYKDFQSLDLPSCIATGANVFKNLAGQPIPFPKVSYGGTVSYEAQAGNYIINPSLSYNYRSDNPSWLRLGSLFDIKRYWLVNADLTVRPENGRWSASVWGRNIFNTEYDTTRNFFIPTTPVGQVGMPASYGLRVSFDY